MTLNDCIMYFKLQHTLVVISMIHLFLLFNSFFIISNSSMTFIFSISFSIALKFIRLSINFFVLDKKLQKSDAKIFLSQQYSN